MRLDGKPVAVDQLVVTLVKASAVGSADGDAWLITIFSSTSLFARAQRKKERDQASEYMADWRRQKKARQEAEKAKVNGQVRLA